MEATKVHNGILSLGDAGLACALLLGRGLDRSSSAAACCFRARAAAAPRHGRAGTRSWPHPRARLAEAAHAAAVAAQDVVEAEEYLRIGSASAPPAGFLEENITCCERASGDDVPASP